MRLPTLTNSARQALMVFRPQPECAVRWPVILRTCFPRVLTASAITLDVPPGWQQPPNIEWEAGGGGTLTNSRICHDFACIPAKGTCRPAGWADMSASLSVYSPSCTSRELPRARSPGPTRDLAWHAQQFQLARVSVAQ